VYDSTFSYAVPSDNDSNTDNLDREGTCFALMNDMTFSTLLTPR
jgi:hypothetical protein